MTSDFNVPVGGMLLQTHVKVSMNPKHFFFPSVFVYTLQLHK